MEDSIFTKIIKGEVPAHKVYEDDTTLAFLDIHPLQPGHILVVPKQQVDHFDDLDDNSYQAVFATVKKVAKRLKNIFSSQRICVRIEGFDVPHAHVHVYPCNSPKDFYGKKDRASLPSDHEQLANLANKIKF